MSKYCVIGQGLIGRALAKKLNTVSFYPTPVTETVFYFGGVTHLDFENSPDYHKNKEFQDILFLIQYCKKYQIRLVYASSALVYEKDTEFTKHKRSIELLAQTLPKSLGLRIFPVYGKEEKKTVISQWCDDIKNDRQPVVYGDGTQTRDFINVEDVVNQILLLESMQLIGIADVGTGKPVMFNDIIQKINNLLGKDIKPIYKNAPNGYSKGIQCVNPLPVNITIENGLKDILGI